MKTIEILPKEGKDQNKKHPVVMINGVVRNSGDKLNVPDDVAADLIFRKKAKYSEEKSASAEKK